MAKRKPFEIQEEHDAENDTFAVTVAVGRIKDGKPTIEWLGGYISGWSTFSPETQEIVRADLHAVAARDLQAWRDQRHCLRVALEREIQRGMGSRYKQRSGEQEPDAT